MLLPIRELHDYSWVQVDTLVCETLEPVLCRQAFCEWTPVRSWDENYLIEHVGNQRVRVGVSESGEFPSLDPQAQDDVVLTISELLSRFQQTAPPYYYLNGGASFFNLGTQLPALEPLQEDIHLDDEQHPHLLVKSSLWISSSDVRSRLHFDGNACHNMNVQVAGRKEFILLAPNDASSLCLLDDPARRQLGHFSLIDDVALNPHMNLPAGLTRWHATLEPGDALIIPAMWLHAVRSLDAFNINVNYWSIAGQGYLGRLLTKLLG